MTNIIKEVLTAWGGISFMCLLLYSLTQITERILEIKRKIDLVDDLIVRVNTLESYVDRDHMRLIQHILKDEKEKDLSVFYADEKPVEVVEKDG